MTVMVEGHVEPTFAAVREAFEANFAEYDEVGASVCVYHRGRPVVHLWGGRADLASGAPYTQDTLQLVFSTTKGATALCAHLLVQRGVLDLDAPVAEYWPEFGVQGKERIRVRWLLSHRAGMCAWVDPITIEDFLAWDPAVRGLAAQAPLWEPDTAHGYHAVTFGHLVGEVVRRVSGRTLGTFLADEVCAPLGIEFHVGLPASEEHRVAPLIDFDFGAAPEGGVDPMFLALLTPGTMTNLAFTNPVLLVPRFNEPDVHAAEIPAANGITNAHSLARMYASMAGEVNGVRLLESTQVEEARKIQSDGDDLVLVAAPTRIASGWFLPDALGPMLGEGSFGHSGLGGSLGCVLPEEELAFGYVMNRCRADADGDPRTRALLAATLSCLA
ncbi:MAG: serine hydrolase domain-containing protein [Acidimicrobiales bacterium]